MIRGEEIPRGVPANIVGPTEVVHAQVQNMRPKMRVTSQQQPSLTSRMGAFGIAEDVGRR